MASDGFINTILKLTTADPKVFEKNVLPLENVLLNLRYLSLKKNTRSERRLMVFLALPVVWLTKILMLPLCLISQFKTFLLSSLLLLIPYQVFDLISGGQFLILTPALWASLNYKAVSINTSLFLFDFCDVLTGGFLTEKVIYVYSTFTKKRQMDFLNNQNMTFAQHFYSSRQATGQFRESAWEGYFVTVFTKFLNDDDLMRTEVANYWDKISTSNNIYKSYNPPHFLVGKIYWANKEFWQNTTLASLTYAIENTSDINELALFDVGRDMTMLGCAVSQGTAKEFIEIIIHAGADVNFPQEGFSYKFSILSNAVMNCTPDTVQFLIDQGARVEAGSQTGKHTPLNIIQIGALYAEHLENFLILLRNCKDKSLFIDKNGHTLLHYMVEADSDRTEFIENLIKSGADIEARTKGAKKFRGAGEQTALLSSLDRSIHFHSYDYTGPNIKNLQCILQHGANVFAKDMEGRSPINVLASTHLYDKDNLKKLKLLHANRADLNTPDLDGCTPLINAIISSEWKFARLLIELGADYKMDSEAEYIFQSKAFRIGENENDNDLEHLSEIFEIIDFFIQGGFDITSSNNLSDSPLTSLKEKLGEGYFKLSDVPKNSQLRKLLE